MALDRSYGSNYYRPSFFGGFSFFPPVIKWLIISNTAVWLVLSVFLSGFVFRGVPIFAILEEYLALWPVGPNFYPFQLITYMFLHGGFWHLFLNMLVLWMFGAELEHVWGSRKFGIYYLLCGIGAGLSNLAVAPLIHQHAATIGASGAVFGVLVAFGMLFPNRPVYLYFLLPIRAKYFIAGYIALELLYGVTGTSDGVAHFAHLGGALVGFVYLAFDTQLIRRPRWWGRLRPEKGYHSGNDGRLGATMGRVHDAKFFDIDTGAKHEGQDVNQEVIDSILDKISRGGYQSLTEEEKRILNEASRKIH